jgi:hypothetical protein
VNILGAIEGQVAESVERHSQGEDVHYGVSMTLAPAPDGQSVQPILVILLTLPGLKIGERITSTTMSTGFFIDPALPDIIRQMIEGLRNERSSQAAQAMAEAPKPGEHIPNGMVDPKNGSIPGL